MKTFWAYLKWMWSKWQPTQRIWLLGCFFFGAGLSNWWETKEPGLSIQIAWAIWFVVIIKWFIWDTVAYSWQRFKQERKDLLNTIKEGK